MEPSLALYDSIFRDPSRVITVANRSTFSIDYVNI